MRRGIILLGIFLLACLSAKSQGTYPYNGMADQKEGLYALTNATIVSRPGVVLENATLLFQEGKILEIGQEIAVPKHAIVYDLTDQFIYPAFIDLYSGYGMPAPKAEGKKPRMSPQMLSNKKGAFHWNEAMRPETRAHEHFTPDTKAATALRKHGFGAVATHYMNGISRGSSVLVSLGEAEEKELILAPRVAHHLSFRKGKSTQSYPSSLMGVIALIRQTYYDAQWYENQNPALRKEINFSLEAWNELQDLPQIFELRDKWDAFRAAKIAREFGKTYILKGCGEEYQRLDEIQSLGMPFILPLTLPKPFDIKDPYDAHMLDYSQLKHWEMAPSNAAWMAEAGIPIAFTAHGLEDKETVPGQVRKLIRAGLSEEDALRALTLNPAEWIGQADRLGSLEKGKWANFLVCSGPIFQEKSQILQNWVQGKAYTLKDPAIASLNGTYELSFDNESLELTVKGTPHSPAFELVASDSIKLKVKGQYQFPMVSLAFSLPEDTTQILLNGTLSSQREWKGEGLMANGQWIPWKATLLSGEEATELADTTQPPDPVLPKRDIVYPFTAYGWREAPQPNQFLIQNATVWTNEEDGILENTDVLVEDGRIRKIGNNLSANGATIIDGEGKHLTCGIIDEHSHIGISRGVNEGTQSSSAEVRIGDVIDPENINLYRQLAGGVTAAQLLHGSANPIGGQSALVKFRWGAMPEAMKIEGADGFIKFALGENVKQSNWGDNNRTRYPQTRMGVEQVYENYFTRAREYEAKKQSGQPYRVDLELEAILEILNEQRFITCHSYQQGEINMLMKVAERFDFTINTFTHILEGYKIADKMAEHGAAGSSFADWWAYKYEVIDAIPYNGALLHEQGVLTSFNSDDAEMARRLNQEAAKAVKYGGVSEEEAWKFVTLNPAKMLHLDDRMGSIKEGKDADLVLWSDNPLSMYAMVEKTFIDGRLLFDRDRDLALRQEIEKERQRLIQKMMRQKQGGTATQAVKGRMERHYHCDDLRDEVGE